MKAKRPRIERVKSGALVPSERLYDVLTLTALCRFISTEQIAREFFPSLDRARRNVRRLFDAGYVDIRITTSTESNIVSITRLGLEFLLSERPELAVRVRLPGVLRLTDIERHLAGVDARLFAAAWGIANNRPLIRWSPRYGSLGEQLGLPAGLELDAIAEFETAHGRSHFVAIAVAVTPEALRAVRSRLDLYAPAPPEFAIWIVVRGREQAWTDPTFGDRLVVVERAHLAARPVRPLPGGARSRAEGPASPDLHSGESAGATRCLRTERRP